jgi:hypothetical protein
MQDTHGGDSSVKKEKTSKTHRIPSSAAKDGETLVDLPRQLFNEESQQNSVYMEYKVSDKTHKQQFSQSSETVSRNQSHPIFFDQEPEHDLKRQASFTSNIL